MKITGGINRLCAELVQAQDNHGDYMVRGVSAQVGNSAKIGHLLRALAIVTGREPGDVLFEYGGK